MGPDLAGRAPRGQVFTSARGGRIDFPSWLGQHAGVAVHKSADKPQPEDDTALLIAALNHSTGWYEARIDRGLQVMNYFVVAGAVLATAYVSAIGGKHYAIAAVVSLSGTALGALAFLIGRSQRHRAAEAEPALAELQSRVAQRLDIGSFKVIQPRPHRESSVRIAFALAILLSLGSAMYALVH
jgi:hypothetical protein